MEITCLLRGSELEHFSPSFLLSPPLFFFFFKLFLLWLWCTLSYHLLTVIARFSMLFTLTVVVFTTPTKLHLLTCGALKRNPARLSLMRQIEQWDASYKTSCGWKLSLDVSITWTVGINLWAICRQENYGGLSLAQLFVTTQGKFCCTNKKKHRKHH